MSILDNVMGEYGFAVPKAAYDKLQEHIAARQPVGQEPVGTIRDRDGVFEIELSESAHDTDADALDGCTVYLAPPAQAVDLVQEHVATLTVDDDGMLGWSLTHIGRDLPEGEYRLALIDSKAVGK